MSPILKDAPWAIAHRGASRFAPENTQPAFDKAVDAATDAIEVDLQLSRDGVPVVYHDQTLDRIGQGIRGVDQWDFQQLKEMDFGGWFSPEYSQTHILSLEELLGRYAGSAVLMIEIKEIVGKACYKRHAILVQKLIDQIRKFKVESRVMILCFDLRVLQAAYNIAPDLRYVWNLRKAFGFTPANLNKSAFLYAYSIKVKSLTPDFVENAHRAGKPVFTFTVNSEGYFMAACKAGVDGMMTDNPSWMVRLIFEQELRRSATD